MVAASLVLPLFLCNWLRMKDSYWRFAFVMFAILASTAVLTLRWPPKLGIDLRGGVILVYEVMPTASGDPVDMERLVGTVRRRLDPSNVRELNVRPFGTNSIEIIVPDPQQNVVKDPTQAKTDQDELDRIKRSILTSGALQFRIMASTHMYQNRIDLAKAQEARERAQNLPILSTQVKGEDGAVLAEWVAVKSSELGQINVREFTVREAPTVKGPQVQALVVTDDFKVTGEYLIRATPGFDEQGQPAVNFSFNGEGAQRFYQLTARHAPNNGQLSFLGIVLDGVLQSAPSLREAISANGQISGSFSEQEVNELSEILTAGSLPAALNPVPLSEELVSPTLGEDTIAAGVNSMLVAVGVVVVFMVIYYRFAGIVANLALILNVALTVAFMMMFNAAFTLSGLAGLALTVGMAVDANVLIYERMREELSRGATLRMAIRNGFDRASVTIIDANLTTLITAVVLYLIGTDQVKGFAVTLTVGLVFNLFTAITVSRLIFDIVERNRWVTNMKFLQIMGNTSFDFIGKRYACYAFSAVLIGAGLVGTAIRGSNLLNIDFTGGVSVTVLFKDSVPGGIAAVRKEVEGKLPEATVQEVQMQGKPNDTGFKIVTSDDSREHVEKTLKELFGEKLVFHNVTHGAAVALPGTLATLTVATPTATPSSTATTTPTATATPTAAASPTASSPPASTPTATPSPTAAPRPTASPTGTAPAANQGSDLEQASFDDVALASADEPSSCDQEPTATTTPTAAASPTATASATPVATATAAATPAATATSTAAGPSIGAPLSSGPVPADVRFAGGTQFALHFDPPISAVKLEEALVEVTKDKPVLYNLSAPDYLPGSAVSRADWTLQLAATQADSQALLDKVEQRLADQPIFPSSANVGANVAGSAKQSAAVAMIVGLGLVMVYVWFRFQNMAFGIAAIVALVHDVMVTIGMLALSYWLANFMGFALVEPFKIDLTIVAALLTIIGFSINDTIVIFDRIREVRGKSPTISADLINLCVNQTLSRTILTSLTVFLVVTILYFFGGPGIHGFAFALVVGTMSGTYSTIYVASPVLLWLHQRASTAATSSSSAAETRAVT